MASRKVVEVKGHPGHRNPIPVCVTLGDLILPSVIGGMDARTGSTSPDPQKQVEQAFLNMKEIVEAAGGTTDGIGKIIFYLQDMRYREFVNVEWLKLFPKENDRPARHVIKAEHLTGNTVIQMDVIASR